jgi:hypothetical protein
MKSKTVIKQVRKHYSPEFRKQALVRAGQDGVAMTAKELGLHESQLLRGLLAGTCPQLNRVHPPLLGIAQTGSAGDSFSAYAQTDRATSKE